MNIRPLIRADEFVNFNFQRKVTWDEIAVHVSSSANFISVFSSPPRRPGLIEPPSAGKGGEGVQDIDKRRAIV